MKTIKYCQELIGIDSPSGFGNKIQTYLIDFAKSRNLACELTNKGNINIKLNNDEVPTRVVATHIDTLGLMISKIEQDGTIRVSPIGGPIASTLNGEYARLYTRDDQVYTGTLLIDSNSKHVFTDSEKQVTFDDMYFRIDQKYTSDKDIRKLGIEVGDYICYYPKFEVSGDYIKSRFLDNKLCAAIALDTLDQLAKGQLNLNEPTVFSFTLFEEVGHGLSYVDNAITNIIALDMACIGDGLNGREELVSICAKDSSGPYDYNWVTSMRNTCIVQEIDYTIDVYPFYGSDASSAMRGGNDVKCALIGPGISASHGMERASIAGVINTQKLLISQIQGEVNE